MEGTSHKLAINENDFPEKYKAVIRRLQIAIAEPEVQEIMDLEDEILTEFEMQERSILEQRLQLEEQGKTLKEQGRALKEKDQTIEERDQVIEEKDQVIEENEKKLEEQSQELQRLKALLENHKP